jgi:hypothetical protein
MANKSIKLNIIDTRSSLNSDSSEPFIFNYSMHQSNTQVDDIERHKLILANKRQRRFIEKQKPYRELSYIDGNMNKIIGLLYILYPQMNSIDKELI